MERSQNNLIITFLRGNSAEFLKYQKDERQGFTYIDGNYEIGKAKSDLQAANRLNKRGAGLIRGDNLENSFCNISIN